MTRPLKLTTEILPNSEFSHIYIHDNYIAIDGERPGPAILDQGWTMCGPSMAMHGNPWDLNTGLHKFFNIILNIIK